MKLKSVPKPNIDLKFQTRLVCKKNRNPQNGTVCSANNFYEGIFTGLSVEIIEEMAIREFYNNGCFGKGSHSRSAPALVRKTKQPSLCARNESLVLELEEAFFLAYLEEVLKIKDLQGFFLDWREFLEDAETLNFNFIDNLASYLYLKSKFWIVKSGLKFGGEFVIYKDSPEKFHASFIVHVVHSSKSNFFEQKHLKGVQRVAESSNKDVLLLKVMKPENFILNSIEDLQEIKISEIVVRRIKLSSFVQNPSVNN